MTKKLFVGNLAYAMTDDQLLQIFSAHGKVVSANIIKDRFSGRSKGFGFVEFETEAEAEAAMKAVDGTEQEGRNIVVKEATPRPDSSVPASGPAPAAEPVAEAGADNLGGAVPTAEAAIEEAPVTEEAVAPVKEAAEAAPATQEAPVTEEPVAPMEDVAEAAEKAPVEAEAEAPAAQAEEAPEEKAEEPTEK